jgi:FkbH-like protein
VLVLSPEDVPTLMERPEFGAGKAPTAEAARRVQMYAEEEQRRAAEETFAGSRMEFLRSCDMRLRVCPASDDDLPRINEMVARTNQLNSTGERYSPDEVARRLQSPDYRLIVASLQDRFGDYGMIGCAFVESGAGSWLIELLMLSCRVEGRGIPAAVVRLILDEAVRARVPRLDALYRRTSQNTQMLLLLRGLGFRAPSGASDAVVAFSRSTEAPLPEYPEWLQITNELNVDDRA